MECLEQGIIQGTTAKNDCVNFSPIDMLIGHFYTEGVYFFSKTPDISRMKASLAKTLDIYPDFGGVILKHGNVYLLHRNNTGAHFCVMKADTPRPDLETPIAIDSPLLSREVPATYVFNSGMPTNYFRVTLFTDGSCAFSIRTIHSLGDGNFAYSFLASWTALYNGRDPIIPDSYSRDNIAKLGIGSGFKPSPKLPVLPVPNFDLAERVRLNNEAFSTVHINIDGVALAGLVAECKSFTGGKSTSSDVIHALAWKAFAASAEKPEWETSSLYTAFDTRRVEGLGIPTNYTGNALTQRAATATFGVLRSIGVAELAKLYAGQIKPVTEHEIRQNIAFLNREYSLGRVDAQGRYSHFVLQSTVDCLEGIGLHISDQRFIRASGIGFEEDASWYETIFFAGRPYIFVYQKADGTVCLRYSGPRDSLKKFSDIIQNLLHNRDS